MSNPSSREFQDIRRSGQPSGELHTIKSRWWVPARTERDERIDSPDNSFADFRESFRDIRTINRLFGGTSVVLTRVSRLLAGSSQPVTVLDVGSGSADIPLALARWGRKRGTLIQVTASDVSATILGLAKIDQEEDPNLDFLVCDATSLPFGRNSFDIVTCSLTLHHFDDTKASNAIKEMYRVARQAVVINDLRRAYLPAGLIWLVTRALRMNNLTKHDGPLSVMRSRTLPEYSRLARLAGVMNAETFSHPFWRAAIVARKSQ